ncbi:SPOR domain-containing protein [Clostridium manihotivorum]|uniref:SPOR domain-containing protein n=1 Tax=Clostridium manihotivorum TaxID=2320868 RepID=A0A410DR10_9CLOT|nr:SPOR domain-containing protein [Clostridium manihotivorum]QAA31498.1 hypothetical protein C1I91_07530 [Clostridium manihotivorum]
MKYTRYDLNKRQTNGGKVMVFLVVVVVIALTLGTALAKYLFAKSPGEQQSPKVSNSKQISDSTKGETTVFSLVQCGFYSKKENADDNKNKLKDKYDAFTIKDNDKFRVGVIIGKPEDADKVAKDLTAAGVTNLKVNFEIGQKDLCTKELAEMINGYLKIISTLEGKDTKSVKTEEFKKWTNSLQEDSKSESFNIFQSMKKNINDLPQEISKDNVEACYNTIFSTLSNFKKQ